ncbi:MAG: response regulator [Desulfobacterales bacterium]
MTTYRIVLADDHTMMREGIRKLINGDDRLTVTAEAGDGLELLRLLNQTPADLVILDISMPGLGGIEAAKEIKTRHPELAVLILSMHKKKEYLKMALAAGAKGYLTKENTAAELLSAIHAIRKGGTYLSPSIAAEFASDLIDICRGDRSAEAEDLTSREQQVLKLIAEGQTNQRISELLYISPRTVHRHRSNIRRKLSLKRTADLVKYAIRKGMVSP